MTTPSHHEPAEDVVPGGSGLATGVVEAVVEAEAAGQRLDSFLAGSVAGLSRSRAKALILAGRVSLAGATLGEPKRQVNSGEAITVDIPEPEPAEPAAEAIPLTVVYEDADLIVIDKPAGLVVHPAAGHATGTLVNALLAHCGDSLSGIGGVRRPGIVHRLDKDTTGLMVVAKTDAAHASLAAQFADHGRTGPLERGYRALVWGVPERRTGMVSAAIDRSRSNRQLMAVTKTGGREAITHYTVEKVFGRTHAVASLLDLRLETGRTHQIRVHLTALGHPVIGDPDYGTGFRSKLLALPAPASTAVRVLGRQALHAYLLGFEHPSTGETHRFNSPLPDDMSNVIKQLDQL